MTFLFLSVLCSSGIAIVFSWSEAKKGQWSGILVANYFFATLLSVPFFWQKSIQWIPLHDSFFTFQQEYLQVFSTHATFSPSATIFYSILLGIVAGLLFFGSLVLYRYSIRYNGLAISGTFAKLGISVPVLMSLLLWNIFPSLLQWSGIILSMVAVLFLYNWKQPRATSHFSLSLIFVLVLMGLAEFSNKIFQQYAVSSYKSLFLFVVFGTAFLYSVLNQLIRKTKFGRKELLFGLLIGILNYGSSYFLIQALGSIPAVIAFPMFSAGTILCISVFSRIVLKEKWSQNMIIAIILSTISVILMNSR